VALVERSLARLPDKMSRAFVMREVLGLSTEEVCRALEVTPTHCWVLVYRARRGLRECPDVGRFAAEAA
jgi:RNA polymerase sigma-70 factor (ECF subfamily)